MIWFLLLVVLMAIVYPAVFPEYLDPNPVNLFGVAFVLGLMASACREIFSSNKKNGRSIIIIRRR